MITSTSTRYAFALREFPQASAADEVLVACAIGDAQTQHAIVRAAVLGGARPVVVTGPLPQFVQATRSCSVLVWDVAPWDAGTLSFLERVGRQRPDLPVLALLPSSELALGCVALCRRQAGVHIEVVDPLGARRGDIGEAVCAVLADLPPFVVARELGRLGGNRWLARVMWCALTQVGRGTRPTVTACARAAGRSPRTLERLVRSARLPTPKELIDWATVLHIKHAELMTGNRPADLARAIGLSGNDMYRLRQRLAQRVDVEPRTIRDADFRQVLDHCTRRCGLAPTRTAVDGRPPRVVA